MNKQLQSKYDAASRPDHHDHHGNVHTKANYVLAFNLEPMNSTVHSFQMLIECFTAVTMAIYKAGSRDDMHI